MQDKDIKVINIFRGYKVILFFILLESLTVPLVALFNTIALQNVLFMAIMGFGVALLAVFFLLKILNKWIINYVNLNVGVVASKVKHLWYLGVIGGVLEMVMFLVQNELFKRGHGDYSAGFWSALISVAVALLIYKFILMSCKFGVTFISTDSAYSLDIRGIDILRLSILMAIYEFIVCPITGWWIPYAGMMRILVALLSAIIGAFCGASLILLISKLIPSMQPRFYFSTRT